MCLFGLHKKILHNLPQAVVVLDKKGRVRFCNAVFCTYLPYSPKRGKIGEVFGSAAEKELSALILRVIARKIPETAFLTLPTGMPVREISLRLGVYPVDKNLAVGIVEGVAEEELKKELEGAQALQQRLLPVGKEAGGVPYAFTYIPCREVGGDMPDVYEVAKAGKDYTFGLLADVSGHGVSAAMLSSFVKAGIDRSDPSPSGAVSHLTAKFAELNLDERAYITVAAVSIDKAAGRFAYTLAGHNAPILLKTQGEVHEIEQTAPPVSTWFTDYPYENGEISYRRGDILVLLTDGATENRNADGEQFGIERVESLLLSSGGAHEFIDRLQEELKAFCPVLSDDITAIAFDL